MTPGDQGLEVFSCRTIMAMLLFQELRVLMRQRRATECVAGLDMFT